jgi:alkyl hydroperoxide reductase subunit AhpC
MTQFESAYDEFMKRNAGVIFVAAQKIEGLFKGKEHVQKRKYPFPVVFDETREVTRSYGVHHAVGIDAYNIARRAIFVVGGEGKICWIAVSPHQREAPPVQDVLSAIESCGKY